MALEFKHLTLFSEIVTSNSKLYSYLVYEIIYMNNDNYLNIYFRI